MPTVFVVANRHPEIEGAREWGTLVYLSHQPIPKFSTDIMRMVFGRALEKANEEDYILVSGLSVMSGIVIGIMASRFGIVNMLLYSKPQGKYVLRRVKF